MGLNTGLRTAEVVLKGLGVTSGIRPDKRPVVVGESDARRSVGWSDCCLRGDGERRGDADMGLLAEACGGVVILMGTGVRATGASIAGEGGSERVGSARVAGALDSRGERRRGVGVVMSRNWVLAGGAGGVEGATASTGLAMGTSSSTVTMAGRDCFMVQSASLHTI